MNNENRKRIVFSVLLFCGIVDLFIISAQCWPVLLLIIPAILIVIRRGLAAKKVINLDSKPKDADVGSAASDEKETTDYTLAAFQWVEANLQSLNNRCIDAIAEGCPHVFLSEHDLPDAESWPAVYDELKRRDFSGLLITADGINITLTK